MAKTYTRLFFLSAVIAVLLGAALNYAIDPYGLYRVIDLDGINKRKPKSGTSSQLVKPYRVLEVGPRTLVLGNSRVEVGIDPESPRWPAAAGPVFNMALPATGIETAVRSLQHAKQHGPLTLVVLGVDFFDFVLDERARAPAQPRQLTEFDKRLLVKPDGSRNDFQPLQKVIDHATVLFSLNSLIDSVQTVGLQRLADQPDLTELGFNPMHEYRRFVRVDGHHALFRQVDTTYLTNYLRVKKPAIYAAGGTTSEALDDLRALIRLCRAGNVRLVLYVHPYHAHMLENYHAAGMWPLFEEWKRALVKIVDEETAAAPGGKTVELWDFSGYNEITGERVPAASEKGRTMRWYWEAGHYKREVGELVLASVVGTPQSAPAGFGVRLTAQNLESHLAAIRAQRQAYLTQHRDEAEGIEKLAAGIRTRMEDRPARR